MNNEHDQQYAALVRRILEEGEKRDDRTGTGTLSIFGTQMRFDLRQGFPLITTKKVLFPAIVRELLWFLRGSTNINDELTQHTPIWDAWADDDGELGPVYGFQWRHWGKTPCAICDGEGMMYGRPCNTCLGTKMTGRGVDQIKGAIDLIKRDPTSRRIIVSAWNVADLDRMALPPCHLLFQFYVSGNRLDCQLYQRSADMALGVPFNIASYALLTTMIAQECGLEPGYFILTLGDAHIYLNHVDGLTRQLARDPYSSPVVHIARKPIFELTYEDIELVGYQHHPFIRFDVAV